MKIACLELRAAFGRRWRGQSVPGAIVVNGSGGSRVVGEVTTAGLTRGVRRGMAVGRAVELCPGILLAESDPVKATQLAEGLFQQLEDFGASLEIGLPGEAFFYSAGLEPLHGGRATLLRDVCSLTGGQAGVGAGPTRLAALSSIGPPGSDPKPITADVLWDRLGSLPLDCLANRLGEESGEWEEMRASLERLGIATLRQLRELGRDALADRFGEVGLSALAMASGKESVLQPREPLQRIAVSIDLWSRSSIESLHRALALLCSRISERLVRLGKVARSFLLETNLQGGGSWRRSFVPRCPTADEGVIRSILSPALERLPAPPVRMALEVRSFSDGDPEQFVILPDPVQRRKGRLDRAATQVEEALGRPGLMKVVEAEPNSPLPERRLMLVPHVPG